MQRPRSCCTHRGSHAAPAAPPAICSSGLVLRPSPRDVGGFRGSRGRAGSTRVRCERADSAAGKRTCVGVYFAGIGGGGGGGGGERDGKRACSSKTPARRQRGVAVLPATSAGRATVATTGGGLPKRRRGQEKEGEGRRDSRRRLWIEIFELRYCFAGGIL